jgi:hypothetical protein
LPRLLAAYSFVAEVWKPALRKQFELPSEDAKTFVRDMKELFKAKTVLDRDEVAAGTAWTLKNHLPRGTKLRITDVKELFLQMKDHE